MSDISDADFNEGWRECARLDSAELDRCARLRTAAREAVAAMDDAYGANHWRDWVKGMTGPRGGPAERLSAAMLELEHALTE